MCENLAHLFDHVEDPGKYRICEILASASKSVLQLTLLDLLLFEELVLGGGGGGVPFVAALGGHGGGSVEAGCLTGLPTSVLGQKIFIILSKNICHLTWDMKEVVQVEL